MNHLELLRPIRGHLILASFLQGVAGLLALLPLLALILFTGAWLTGDPAPGLGVLVAAIAGTLGSLAAAAAATILTHRADADLTLQLQNRLADTIRHLPIPVLTGQGAGRIKKVVHDDTDSLHYLLAHTLLDVTALIVTPLAGGIALAMIDWRLALVSLLPLAAGIGWFVRAMRGSGKNFAEYATAQQRINTAIVDYVRGLPVAKVYGGPGSAQTRFQTAVTGFHDFFRTWSSGTAAVTTASWLIVTPAVTVTLLTLTGAIGLHLGWITHTALVAGVLLGPAISAPVAVAGPRLQAIRAGLSALASIGDFLAQPRLTWGDDTPKPEQGSGTDHRSTAWAIHFEQVSYRYENTSGGVGDGGADRAAIEDLTLALPSTGLVAIVGASGSGKSTLAGLLARFIDPTAGRILLDDIPLHELPEAELYERIGFVFQDTGLRQASVRDTLSGGRPVTEADIIAATTAAAIYDDLLALPSGYDTIIGEHTDLSGGQRQRLALARALLRHPDILVLDEATSAVDPHTRASLMRTLTREAVDRTVLLITHQLRTVTGAQQILVLDHGRLAGVGTHPELLDTCPAYRTLWNAEAPEHHDLQDSDELAGSSPAHE